MENYELSPVFSGAISDVEDRIERTLNRLKKLTPQSSPSEALQLALAMKAAFSPYGYSTKVQLEEDGRKKRSTADAANFRFATGEIVVMFEPDTSLPAADSIAQRGSTLPDSTASSPHPLQDNGSGLEIEQFCEALSQTTRESLSFVSVKRFRDLILPAYAFPWCKEQGGPQRVLNASIAAGRVIISKIPNPKNPSFPTSCLTLSPVEVEAAKSVSRFNPIPMKGEPASVTLLNDRG